jgi:uncharacterized protein (DUF433 family)
MNLPDFLTWHPYNEIRLTGHRIGLEHVVQLYQEGMSTELIVEHYPSLPLALVQQVISYYQANKAEVDAYVTACQAEVNRQRATAPKGPTLEELRGRMDAKRFAQGA